jgi:FtsH-binding integral membrane protein
MKNVKPFLGIGLALIFIFMGVFLIGKDEKLVQIIGYANILFFSGLILFSFYKLISKK